MISNFQIKDSKIFINLSEEPKNYSLALLKRCSPEIWKYHTGVLTFNYIENTWSLDVSSFKKFLHPYEEVYCDCFLYDLNNETEQPIKIDANLNIPETHGEYSFVFGNIHYIFYKNKNEGLSLKLRFTPAYNFNVIEFEENDKNVVFKFETTYKSKFEIFIARRSISKHKNQYDAFIPLEYTQDKDGYVCEVQKEGLLVPYALKENEIWDIVAKFDEFLITAETELKLQSNYFDTSDEIQSKFFISDGKFLSIFTKYTSFKKQPKINIAVLGSCFTREVFHSLDFYNPDYKKFYNVCLTGFHQSMLSLTSKPAVYDEKDIFLPTSNTQVEKYAKKTLDKTFFDDLKASNADYLIIDQYVDAQLFIHETIDGAFIPKTSFLELQDAFNKLPIKHIHGTQSEKRFELYKKHVDLFAEKIKSIMPYKNIVIVRAHATTKKFDGKNFSDWGESIPYINYQKIIWQRNDDYLISKLPGCRVIDMRGDKYYSEKSYLNFNRNHLNSAYYRDILNNLNKIVLQDLIKKLGDK